MQKQTKNLSVALLASLVSCAVTAVMMNLERAGQPVAYGQPAGPNGTPGHGLAAAQDLSSAFRNVADVMRPSVVNIRTSVTRRAIEQLPPGLGRLPPWVLEDLFGDLNQLESPRRRQTGMGSGVIVRGDGYILTNNHVVEGADDVEVELFDRRTVPGKIVGTDPETDLAVLKIDADRLQPAPFGDSDAIRVGDWVLAIGSPFGLEQTVTAGIISGKNRVQGIVRDGEGYEDFLQTDAAINPGNSGGPLLDASGRVIGVNTAIFSPSGASAGIGFAVPIDTVSRVVPQLIATGRYTPPALGVRMSDRLSRAILGRLGVEGVLVLGVTEGSGAEAAGLRPTRRAGDGRIVVGDIIEAIDGEPVRSTDGVYLLLERREPGETVTLRINRGGERMEVPVTLG